jgi:hypothetical protein
MRGSQAAGVDSPRFGSFQRKSSARIRREGLTRLPAGKRKRPARASGPAVWWASESDYQLMLSM